MIAASGYADREVDEFDQLELDYDKAMKEELVPQIAVSPGPIPKVQIRRITGPEPALPTARQPKGSKKPTSKKNSGGRCRGRPQPDYGRWRVVGITEAIRELLPPTADRPALIPRHPGRSTLRLL